jgi:hypothetical protein
VAFVGGVAPDPEGDPPSVPVFEHPADKAVVAITITAIVLTFILPPSLWDPVRFPWSEHGFAMVKER